MPAASIFGISTNPVIILVAIVAFLLFVGTFEAASASLVILVSIFKPLVVKAGIDPVHFGLIMVLTLMIGLLTPPVGSVLYVISDVAEISFARMVKGVFPYLIPLMVTLLLIVFLPGLVTYLPNLIMK